MISTNQLLARQYATNAMFVAWGANIFPSSSLADRRRTIREIGEEAKDILDSTKVEVDQEADVRHEARAQIERWVSEALERLERKHGPE